MKSRDNLRKGKLVTTVLAGAWRSVPFAPLNLSEAELDEVTPLLLGCGAAALGWRRIANTDLRNTSSGEVLHQVYRLQALQAEILERKIGKVFRLLNQSRVEGIVAKGWAAAANYPAPGLRPTGDIDLCLRPEHFKLAEQVLSVPEANDCWVDLHKHFHELKSRSIDEIFDRSSLICLGQEEVRILCPEDHLALLCIHFLKHGAWRPLWLCDIGVAIESLPPGFDWSICLGRNQTRASWIKCAIGLAGRLLEAKIDNLPIALDEMEPPAWLVENVLQQWVSPFPFNQAPMSHPLPMVKLLRHPTELVDGLRKRWPNAIIATVSVDGRFNNFPRLPYQMANCIFRIGRLVMDGLKSGRRLDLNRSAEP